MGGEISVFFPVPALIYLCIGAKLGIFLSPTDICPNVTSSGERGPRAFSFQGWGPGFGRDMKRVKMLVNTGFINATNLLK